MVGGILTPCNVARSWHWFPQVTAPCIVACGSGIMTMNSPSGSTLQCGRCHWIRPNVRHIGIQLLVSISSISQQWTCHSAICTSLRNFIRIGPASTEKNDVISIFKMADLRHLVFKGSNNGLIEKPTYDFHPSSIDTIAVNCLFFEKITFLHFGVEIQDSRWISVFSIDHCWVVIWTVQYSLYHVIVDRLLATN